MNQVPIRIALADDSDLMLAGAKTTLEHEPGYQVVGCTSLLADLLACLDAWKPQVVILSEWLYDTDILGAVEQVLARQADIAILVLGALTDGLLIQELLTKGVKGYLYRADALCPHLPLAVASVLRGKVFLSPTASAEYLTSRHSPEPKPLLDETARAVLKQLAQGQTIGQIALALHIPRRQVYSIRARLRRRFHADTNEHLISRAVAEGFAWLPNG